ncbi:hypothetical protein SAMN04488056_101314 [Cohaesibacter marisflavi]|uniref:Uncharacterized protein n=1 Tax=Cohaesibacter marisflavi TaxID=655353 RepID=A0A1I5A1X6_9HYPH|nr:hypothetical protein SAMN04488056_101314 [Cohaesibacter marisflavi]
MGGTSTPPLRPECLTKLSQNCTFIILLQTSELSWEHVKQAWQISVAYILSLSNSNHVSDEC